MRDEIVRWHDHIVHMASATAVRSPSIQRANTLDNRFGSIAKSSLARWLVQKLGVNVQQAPVHLVRCLLAAACRSPCTGRYLLRALCATRQRFIVPRDLVRILVFFFSRTKQIQPSVSSFVAPRQCSFSSSPVSLCKQMSYSTPITPRVSRKTRRLMCQHPRIFVLRKVALLSRAIMPRQMAVEELGEILELLKSEAGDAESKYQFVDVREEEELGKAKLDGERGGLHELRREGNLGARRFSRLGGSDLRVFATSPEV